MKDPRTTIWLTVGDEYATIGFHENTPCTPGNDGYPRKGAPILTLREAQSDERFKGDFLVHSNGGWDVASWSDRTYLHGTWRAEFKTLPDTIKMPEGVFPTTKRGWGVFLDVMYEHLRECPDFKAKLAEYGIEIGTFGWKISAL